MTVTPVTRQGRPTVAHDVTVPLPYTSLACRWHKCTACDIGPHDPQCNIYCVSHCAHECHYPKAKDIDMKTVKEAL